MKNIANLYINNDFFQNSFLKRMYKTNFNNDFGNIFNTISSYKHMSKITLH